MSHNGKSDILRCSVICGSSYSQAINCLLSNKEVEPAVLGWRTEVEPAGMSWVEPTGKERIEAEPTGEGYRKGEGGLEEVSGTGIEFEFG